MYSKIAVSSLCFFFLLVMSGHAQKGSWYLGGQVGFNLKTEKTTGTPDIKTTTWNVAPEVGTFLENHLQLGFAVNLGGNHTDSISGFPATTETTWSPVVYLRRFYPVGDKFSVYTGVAANFEVGSSKVGSNDDGKISGWGLNLTLGAAFAVSKTFTVVGQYGLFGYTYQSIKYSDNDKTSTSNFGLNVNSLGPVFNVGLYWTFKE